MAKILVIGAGASGMMAAGQAALAGADVTILEKMGGAGKKILISGKGRCNITNNSEVNQFLTHFNRNGRFLHQPFSQFFAPELMTFFENLGLSLITERGDRVFPASGNSHDVVSTLLRWLKSLNVTIRFNTPVTSLILNNGSVQGVRAKGQNVHSDSVILATGGSSYPSTGSSGDGYVLLENAGHTIVPLRPALIPLVVKDSMVHTLAGLDVKNTGLRIFINGKRKKVDFGEVGFTRFGIGGPLILTHSLFLVDNIKAGNNVELALDLKPALDEQKLDSRLLRDLQKRHDEKLESVLRGLLPKQLVKAALHYCGLDRHKEAGNLRSQERRRLLHWLKDFRIKIDDYRPLREAIVTAGGVAVKEVAPHTMESKLIKGLYITGELLDIHGDTGGYNLQAAFSTGWLAGKSAP